MTTLKDFLNDMLIEYKKKIDNGEEPETARLFVIEEYLVYIKNRLIGE